MAAKNCLHLGILHIVAGLGFKYVDAVLCLRHEVRLVFQMVGA
jgi:hypothetical protein